MNVLIDLRPLQSPEYARRGIGTYARNLVRVLGSPLGRNLTALVASNFPSPDAHAPGGTVAFYRPRLRKLAPFYFIFDRAAIRAKLRGAAFDILHVLEPFRHAVALGARSRIRTVCTVHDLIPLVFPERCAGGVRGRIWNLGVKSGAAALGRVSRIIAISRFTKQDVMNKLGVDDSKISVVYQSYNKSIFNMNNDNIVSAAVRARLRLPERFIMYAGGVDRRKDLPTLLRAFSRLSAAAEKNVPLVITGGEILGRGAAAREVRREIARLGIGGRIIATGHVIEEELAALYRLAACMVFPSIYEGFGLPPLEAMACGAPVIAADASSLPEVVGNAGVLFPPGDDAACADAVRRVLDDGAHSARLHAAGLVQAAKFSDDSFLEGTLSAYRTALEIAR